jgi:hypothetical protein
MIKKFVIDPAGGLRHLLDEGGPEPPGRVVSVARNSNVDWTADLSDAALLAVAKQRGLPWGRPRAQLEGLLPAAWWADMLPVSGPVLGPFETRAAALAAEEAYLLERNLPLPARAP